MFRNNQFWNRTDVNWKRELMEYNEAVSDVL